MIGRIFGNCRQRLDADNAVGVIRRRAVCGLASWK